MNDSEPTAGAERAPQSDDTPVTRAPELGAAPIAVAVCGALSLLVILPMPMVGMPLAAIAVIAGIVGVVRRRGTKRQVYLVGVITGLLAWVLLGVAALGLFTASDGVTEDSGGRVQQVESLAESVPSP